MCGCDDQYDVIENPVFHRTVKLACGRLGAVCGYIRLYHICEKNLFKDANRLWIADKITFLFSA